MSGSRHRTAPTWAAFSLSILCLGMLQCGGMGQRLRQHTYPSDFDYISDAELKASMKALAQNIHELDSLLRRNGLTSTDQARVIQILDTLAQLTDKLKQGQRSNRSLLDKNLPRLRADIRSARSGAKANPPYYYYAGALSGSACVYCHAKPL